MRKNNNIHKARGIEIPVRLISLDDACKYLSCCLDMLEVMIGRGEIPIIRFGSPPDNGKKDNRKRWIDWKDLDDLIESKKEVVGGISKK